MKIHQNYRLFKNEYSKETNVTEAEGVLMVLHGPGHCFNM